MFEKLSRMWSEEPNLAVDDLATIEIPVLGSLPGTQDGQLAVIPGASHLVFMEQPGLVNTLIERFLDAKGPPETLMPIRRA